MNYYIGIDDTDNAESRGTGFRARKMAGLIMEHQLGSVKSITRHQLLVDPAIPYTSHNSSACLVVETADLAKLTEFCCRFLYEDAAPGSDVGIWIAAASEVSDDFLSWGQQAKKKVLNHQNALEVAATSRVFLEGLTGTKDGIIGALAAVGLRHSGNDGRFIWIRETDLRSLKGICKAEDLLEESIVDEIEFLGNEITVKSGEIYLGDWVRPVLRDHKKVIFIVKSSNQNNYEWETAGKDYIKSISQ